MSTLAIDMAGYKHRGDPGADERAPYTEPARSNKADTQFEFPFSCQLLSLHWLTAATAAFVRATVVIIVVVIVIIIIVIDVIDIVATAAYLIQKNPAPPFVQLPVWPYVFFPHAVSLSRALRFAGRLIFDPPSSLRIRLPPPRPSGRQEQHSCKKIAHQPS